MRLLGTNTATACAFLLLCLLWALASLRSDLLPGSVSPTAVSPLLNQASILGLFAIVAAIIALARRTGWPRGYLLLQSIFVGAGLFALPAILVELSKTHIDDSTRVALFSLAPVFAVVLEPYLGSALQSPRRGGLAATLVAVAGTSLIFPVELPWSPVPAVAFCGVILATASLAAANCTAVKIAQSQTTLSLAGFVSTASGSAAILLAIAALSLEPRAWPVAHLDAWAIPDLLALGLLFWLLRRMSAVRMTTRFLIGPLLANLIALTFLRPGVQLRAWLGLMLVALGSGWLLFAPAGEPEQAGSPLGIHQR